MHPSFVDTVGARFVVGEGSYYVEVYVELGRGEVNIVVSCGEGQLSTGDVLLSRMSGRGLAVKVQESCRSIALQTPAIETSLSACCAGCCCCCYAHLPPCLPANSPSHATHQYASRRREPAITDPSSSDELPSCLRCLFGCFRDRDGAGIGAT